ncbi:MAG: glycogen synthase GlgA [Pseudomonadota bacterium]
MKVRPGQPVRPAAPRVLHVGAEIFPLVKTGGLADVMGALPVALVPAGADARVLLPALAPLRAAMRDARVVAHIELPWGGEAAELLRGRLDVPALAGLEVYLLRHDGLYARSGTPYGDGSGKPFADNQRRFAALGLAAARLAEGLDAAWTAQIVHGHDWHAGLAPAYLAHARLAGKTRAASVFTVHNLAYQGLFPPAAFTELGLPAEAYAPHGVEFHHQLSFMKAGLHYADRVTTVSPTYAREIQGHELGCGFDGLLRSRAKVLSGILNGVDEAVWNPASDNAIAHTYGLERMAGKAACKAALQRECGLDVQAEAPLFTVVSRLTEQKGLQLVAEALPAIVERGAQLVVLGSGDAGLETSFARAAKAQPRQVALRKGYDEALSHRIFAASDVSLVPSRFEPCGLTQMYALKYGSLPLVRRTGGLADTVVDCTLEDMAEELATGFVFERFDAADLRRALRRAFTLWARPREWRAVRGRAMAQHFGWDSAAASYLSLYDGLLSA